MPTPLRPPSVSPTGPPGPATIALTGEAPLRAEHAAQRGAVSKALLLHELGVLGDRGGDDMSAARDYLAAFNADPQFREPLEGLVRLLQRRKSAKNLGKLLEA